MTDYIAKAEFKLTAKIEGKIKRNYYFVRFTKRRVK